MHSIEDVKKRVATLVESNRALASDLDSSRRVAAAIGRERDALRRELEMLHRGRPAASTTEADRGYSEPPDPAPTHWERSRPRSTATHNSQLRELRNEWRSMEPAEHRTRELTVALRRSEQERDIALRQLDEAISAMAEIASCLQQSLGMGDAC